MLLACASGRRRLWSSEIHGVRLGSLVARNRFLWRTRSGSGGGQLGASRPCGRFDGLLPAAGQFFHRTGWRMVSDSTKMRARLSSSVQRARNYLHVPCHKLLDLKPTSTSSMNLAGRTSGSQEATMISNPKQSTMVFHRAVGAGLCLGLCLGTVAGSTRPAQDGAAIAVTGHAPEKPETPFSCSLEKSLTKQQREHKRQIAVKMELGQVLLHSPLHPLLLKAGAFRHVQRAYHAWVEKEQNAVPPSHWFRDRSEQFRWRPVCSILMPVHNPRREWLEAAIESAQRQPYR